MKTNTATKRKTSAVLTASDSTRVDIDRRGNDVYIGATSSKNGRTAVRLTLEQASELAIIIGDLATRPRLTRESPCTVDDCTNVIGSQGHIGQGVCGHHYDLVLQQRNLDLYGACTAPKCDDAAAGPSGLCRPHRAWINRHMKKADKERASE